MWDEEWPNKGRWASWRPGTASRQFHQLSDGEGWGASPDLDSVCTHMQLVFHVSMNFSVVVCSIFPPVRWILPKCPFYHDKTPQVLPWRSPWCGWARPLSSFSTLVPGGGSIGPLTDLGLLLLATSHQQGCKALLETHWKFVLHTCFWRTRFLLVAFPDTWELACPGFPPQPPLNFESLTF